MQYLDLFPDPQKASCMSAWNRTYTASFLSDDAEWHHLAVTWTRQYNGRMRIFKDGLMMSEVPSFLTTVKHGNRHGHGDDLDAFLRAGRALQPLSDEDTDTLQLSVMQQEVGLRGPKFRVIHP